MSLLHVYHSLSLSSWDGFLLSIHFTFGLSMCSASLIELLAEVLDAELSLFGKRVVAVEEWLKRYLKVGHVTLP